MINSCKAITIALLSGIHFSIFCMADDLNTTQVLRDPFFDAEPPSYLLDTVVVESISKREDLNTESNSNNKVEDDFFVTQTSNIENETDNDKPIIQPVSPQKVSLTEAAKLIISHHPRTGQVQSAAKGEEEMINVAKSTYYPQIKGGIGARYDNNGSNRYDKDYIQSIDLEIKQTIYDFGKTANAVKSAEYGYLGAEAYVAATHEELIYTATSAVVSIVKYQKLIELSKAQVKQVASIRRLVEQRHTKGASNLSDLLQANSRLDAVKSEELITSSQQQSQLRNLGLLIGKPNLNSASINRLPQELPQACSLPSEWGDIPQIKIAEFESQKAMADLERAGADELPTVSLQGSTSRPLNATSRYGSKFESSVSLNVTVPFYQGGGLSANKRASANRAESAAARKDEVKLEITQRLSETAVRLQFMLQREQLLAQQVENLRGTKELYKKQYLELGTRSLLDLLNSEQEFHQAQVEVESNKSEIIQAQLDCAFYKGKLRQYFNLF